MSEVLTMSGEIKYVGDVGPRGLQGIQGEKGDKPVKSVDYFTPVDIQMMVEEVTTDATNVYNQNVIEKTEEFNTNATNKTNAFDSNATSKTAEFDNNATSKTDVFNSNATSKTTSFDSNASTKTTNYNENAANKTTAFDENYTSKLATINQKASDFNTNYTSKLESFNTNATSKTTAFDNNATSKTNTFNENATTKTNTFNENATNKTNTFDTNASSKTTAFNDNATTKTTAYNDNAQEKIDDFNENADSYLQKDMLEKNFNTSNAIIEGSGQINNALYWNAKVNRFGGGEVSQDTTTGAQLFDKDNANVLNAYINTTTNKIQNHANNRTIYLPCQANETYTISKYASPQIRQIGYTKELPADGVDVYGIVEILANGTTGTITTGEDATYLVCRIMSTLQDTITIEQMLDSIMINKGSSALPYETFTNGQVTPSLDYEQPIKMLTGEVSVEESNENLFDKNNADVINAYISTNHVLTGSQSNKTIIFPCKANKTYTIAKSKGTTLRAGSYPSRITSGKALSNYVVDADGAKVTVTTGSQDNFIYCFVWTSSETYTIQDILDTIQIKYGSTATTYIEHEGQSFSLTLPEGMDLGDLSTASNFIFKNEKNSPYYNSSLVENANYWHKGWNKIASYNGEEITTTYKSTTGELSTGATVCYVLTTEENILIEDTTLNTQLNAMWENMKTYGITNFVITGEDIPGRLDLDYFVDDRIEQNQEIADIKSALLSLGANI